MQDYSYSQTDNPYNPFGLLRQHCRGQTPILAFGTALSAY